MKKAKIAIVSLGHYIYFNQFEGLREDLMKKSGEFAAYIDTERVDLFDGGYIDCVDEAFTAVQKIKREDCDLLFILMSTYVPSAVAAPFARYLDIPQILVGIQPLPHLDYEKATTYMQLVNDDVCAMPEVSGVYGRLGKQIPPCIVACSLQEDETIGYLGHTYEGMYDMHTDPTAFTATFGAHVKMLEMCELMTLTEEVSEAETQQMSERIRSIFEICDPSVDPLTEPVADSDLALSARIAVALENLVKKHHLCALAYYYVGRGEYERVAANLIVGNTLLTSSGIPLAGEADLKTAAAMLIMKSIGGGGSFAEIHPFDIEEDIVLVGHDGPHNTLIAEGKPRLRKLKKYHGKSGAGIGVEFSLKAGPMTLLSINYKKDGTFRMVAAEGESIYGDIPQTGNTNTRVSFGCPVHEFLSRWCEAGPTHHLALGTGHHMNTLRKFARLSGIELVEVR